MQERQTATIYFIPERLNRRPAVYRGMTFFELLLVIGMGSLAGALVGIVVMLLFGIDWYAIFMGMLALGWLAVRLGGTIISRLKRGKPDTWLDRYIELKRSPSQFITYQGFWAIKRTKRKGRLL